MRPKSCTILYLQFAPTFQQIEEIPSMESMEETYNFLDLGGRFKPKECIARHRVAIIVPYRDRDEHLRTFLFHMHSFLPRQQIDYGKFNLNLLIFLVSKYRNINKYLLLFDRELCSRVLKEALLFLLVACNHEQKNFQMKKSVQGSKKLVCEKHVPISENEVHKRPMRAKWFFF